MEGKQEEEEQDLYSNVQCKFMFGMIVSSLRCSQNKYILPDEVR